MAGWFSYNPIEATGETWCGRHEALTAKQPALLAPATPFHLNVLADY